MALEIPREQGPNVRTQPVPRLRPGILLDRTSFGGGVESAAAMNAAGDVARSAAEISGYHVERAEEARFNELAAQLAGEEVRLRTQLEKVEGLGALEASDRMLTDWDAFGEKLQGEAMTDRMRERLGSALSLKKVALQAFGEPYAQGQVKRYEAQVLASRLDQEEAVAIQSGDAKRAGLSIEEQKLALAAHAQATGKPREWLEAQVLERESRIHRGMIGRLVANRQDQAAQKYFEANKDRMAPEDILSVEGPLKTGSTLGEAQRLSDRIFKETKSEREGREAIRKLENLDPQVRQLTEKLLEGRWYDENRFLHDEYEKVKAASVEAILSEERPGNTALEVIGPERWDRLTAADKIQLDGLFTRKHRGGEPDMAAGGWEAWTRWSSMKPTEKAKISDRTMMAAWRPFLNDQFYAAALRDRREAQETVSKGGDLSDLGGWEGTVRDELILAGIDPKSDPEKAARAEMLIKSRVWAFEDQNDRKANPKERGEIMRDALKETVLQRLKDPFGNSWSEKRILRLDAMKKKTELSIWGERQRNFDYQVAVPLDKIGEKDKKELRNLILGRGKNATDEKIERLAGARAMEDLELFEHILSEADRD